MTPKEFLKKIDKELGYVNATREAHFHIQSIIEENKRLLLEQQRQEALKNTKEE